MKHLFDRFDTGEGIVVIGATNFPEVLDKYVSYHFSFFFFFFYFSYIFNAVFLEQPFGNKKLI